MKIRPCIDIHNGKVKQIVGNTLRDETDSAKENFISEHDSAYYADIYKEEGLSGGHVIMLNSRDSEYYQKTLDEALLALRTYPDNLQAGGGITDENAHIFLDAGASHVIVTSYVFKDGMLDEKALMKIKSAVGKEHLVLDLSCRYKDDGYHIVTDRWQKFTDLLLDRKLLNDLSGECDEFLVHAVDVEGKKAGIDKEVIRILTGSPIKVTYAGGVRDTDDIRLIKELSGGGVDVTVGSALSLFGGDLSLQDAIRAAT